MVLSRYFVSLLIRVLDIVAQVSDMAPGPLIIPLLPLTDDDRQTPTLLSLKYSMYNDHILSLINEWSVTLNHDIILKALSNKNTPPTKFARVRLLSN